MPHLRYCNRYWYVAGDELSCPALCSLLSRMVWTALVAAVYGVAHNHLSDCSNGWLIQAYLLISIIVFVADIVCDGLIIFVSMQGSITAMSERKQLGSLLTTRIALICMQTACSIFGIITIANSGLPCEADIEDHGLKQIFIGIVAASQLFDSIIFLCCGSCLIRSSSSMEEEPNEVMQDEMEAWVTWAGRCQRMTRSIQILSCNLFGGGQINEGFEEVAKALVQFFHHQGFLDVVASDVMAGFVLVRLEQRLARKHRTIEDGESDKKTLLRPVSNARPTSPIPRDVEQGSITHANLDDEAIWHRGSVYALAMYTHLMALYVHPCSGLCRLLCHPMRCAGRRPQVVGDNCCGLHYMGMRLFTGTLSTSSEVLYASYVNDTNMKPFGIFLDHASQWVVISIRGTLSLEDCITDATYEPIELRQVGEKWGFDGSNRYGHSGMVRAADHIRSELDRLEVLKKIFSSSTSSSATPSAATPLTDSLSAYSHYRVMVVGHSLGAGAAILLAWMLRKAFPSLHCLAYGVPASVLDRDSCEECGSFVTSFVLDNDLVSRLSFRSLCALRNQVLDAISRAKVNKVYIMKALFKDLPVEDLMHPEGQEPDSAFKQQVQIFKDTLQKRLDKLEHELFLPGRIIHIARTTKVQERLRSRFVYNVFERNLDYFTEIQVSSTMVADHLPDRYYTELMRLGR